MPGPTEKQEIITFIKDNDYRLIDVDLWQIFRMIKVSDPRYGYTNRDVILYVDMRSYDELNIVSVYGWTKEMEKVKNLKELEEIGFIIDYLKEQEISIDVD